MTTEAVKQYQKKYMSTAKGKATTARAQAKYINSWSGRASRLISIKGSYCRTNNIPFDLDVDWLLPRLKGNCEVTGIEFKHIKHHPGAGDKPGPRPFSPSIDRIDRKKGYTKTNCRLVLFFVNSLKGTMSDKQLLEIAEKLVYGLMESTSQQNSKSKHT